MLYHWVSHVTHRSIISTPPYSNIMSVSNSLLIAYGNLQYCRFTSYSPCGKNIMVLVYGCVGHALMWNFINIQSKNEDWTAEGVIFKYDTWWYKLKKRSVRYAVNHLNKSFLISFSVFLLFRSYPRIKLVFQIRYQMVRLSVIINIQITLLVWTLVFEPQITRYITLNVVNIHNSFRSN